MSCQSSSSESSSSMGNRRIAATPVNWPSSEKSKRNHETLFGQKQILGNGDLTEKGFDSYAKMARYICMY